MLDGSLLMAVQGSTRAEKGVHINNSAGRCESGRDVAEALLLGVLVFRGSWRWGLHPVHIFL